MSVQPFQSLHVLVLYLHISFDILDKCADKSDDDPTILNQLHIANKNISITTETFYHEKVFNIFLKRHSYWYDTITCKIMYIINIHWSVK